MQKGGGATVYEAQVSKTGVCHAYQIFLSNQASATIFDKGKIPTREGEGDRERCILASCLQACKTNGHALLAKSSEKRGGREQ